MKNWKLIIVVGSLFVAICAVLYALQQKKLLENKEQTSISQKQEIQAEAKILSKKVDKQGLEHVIIEATQNVIPVKDIDKVSVSEGILDTTAMAMGILKKQVQNLTVIKSTLEVKNAHMQRLLDSSNRPYYSYADKYLKARFTPPTLPNDTTGVLDFSYNADLSITQYQKRNWFLGSKKSYIDIYSNDPRTTVNSVKRLVVEHDSPQFGLRIQTNANFNPSTGSVGFGPAMRVDLGRFSIQGNYTYYPESQRWRPIINGNYDLVRF